MIESKSIVLSDTSPDFTKLLHPPISLDQRGKHEIALIGLDMYNSIPNIDKKNNTLLYEYSDVKNNLVPDEALTYENVRKKITIPIGSYEISAINDYIQKELILHGYPNLFEIGANLNTFKCVIKINNPNVKIDFSENNSIGPLLGFGRNTLEGESEFESLNIVNILSINSLQVNCSVIEGSYLNEDKKPIIYSFFPNVPPGYKIVENPQSPIFLPVNIHHIDKIRIWITDQNGRKINIRGEAITIRLHLRSYFQ